VTKSTAAHKNTINVNINFIKKCIKIKNLNNTKIILKKMNLSQSYLSNNNSDIFEKVIVEKKTLKKRKVLHLMDYIHLLPEPPKK